MFAANRLSNLGIIGVYNHIIGFPEETVDDIKETFNSIERLCQIPNVGFGGPFLFRPYPHTELYTKCLGLGFKEPEILEGWADIYNESEVKYENCPWIGDEIYYLQRVLRRYCKTKNAELYPIFGEIGVGMFPNFSEKEKIDYKKAIDFLRKPNWKRVLKQRVRTNKKKRFVVTKYIKKILAKTHTLELAQFVKRRILR